MTVLNSEMLETINSIISQQQNYSSPVLAAGILGLNPYAFLMIMFAISFVGIFVARLWWNQRQRTKNFREAGNMVACEFCAEGLSKTILCEVFKGQVKNIIQNNRTTFAVSDYIGRDQNKLKERGIFGDIDFYFYLPDHAYPYRWPEGKPFEQQITVMKTHYFVNDPMPKITYRPQDWNPDVYERVTATLLKYAQDEKVAEVAIGELSGKFSMFEMALKFMQKIPLIFLIQLGQCLLLLIVGFMAYKAMGSSDAVAKFITGK